MRTLYIDCFSGVSGDMTVGALIDLGADTNVLKKELAKLDLNDEFELEWKTVVKKGISAVKFDVNLTNETAGGYEDQHGEHRKHGGDHHDHDYNHEHVHDDHHHRRYMEIVKLIEKAGFNDNVTNMSLRIFEIIGKAEAKIHNIPLDTVHFHEVGAVDSIIDIVGTAILIDNLKVDRIVSAPVPVGGGSIHIEHGIYPVPAPATLDILKGVPLQQSTIKGELTTPTGAGIISALANEFGAIPSMKVDAIGYGAGTKDFQNHPNVLRIILGS
jgi:uncharacterized protein (TIGR00299 family) protein